MGPTHVCVQQPFSERQGLKCQPLVWKRVHSKGVVQVAMLADLWGASRTDCHRSTIPVVWAGHGRQQDSSAALAGAAG